MSYTIVCLDLYCRKTKKDADPSYRVFVDDQLVAERIYWPKTPDFLIQEHLTFDDDNQSHTIWVKNIFHDRGKIRVGNIACFDGDTKKPLDINVDNQNGMYTFTLLKR